MPFDKRKALQNALAYTQQGKWDRAIAEYQTILKADPRDLTVCNNLGDLYARAGKPGEAIEQYLKLGDLYRADGLSVKAIAVYKKIAKLDPTRTEAYLACADLYQEQGLVGEAKVQLATVVEHYHKAGDTAKVIEIYQRLTQLDPTNTALLTKLADLLARQGLREAAAAEYGQAAQAAQAAGQKGESRRLFQKAREMVPDSPEPNLGLAEFQLREGMYAEAVSALTKVTAADPANVQAWRLLGEAYGCLGQGPEALGALKKAIALGLPEGEMGRPMSLALVQSGQIEEAIALCQRITEEALTREEPDQAVSLCQALVTAAPQHPALHVQLAALFTRLGRAEEARAATWALAAAYETAGESQAAIQVYHQLLETDPSDAEARARLKVLEPAPAPPAPEEIALPALEEEPGLLLEAMAEAEASVPEVLEVAPPPLELEPQFLLETSAEESLVPGESEETLSSLSPESALTPGETAPAEAPPEQPLEVDQAGGYGEIELPSIQLPPLKDSTEAVEAGAAADDLPPVDFLGEGIAGLGALEGEVGESGEIAEQLAEAEVYLKYGLADKARDRLSGVVRLAPDNLVAHRKLKAIYLERNRIPEACREIVAIARILEARLQPEAALREIQEGLELAPDAPDLKGYLAGARRGAGVASAEPPVDFLPTEEPPIEELSHEIPDVGAAVEEPTPQAIPASDWGMAPSVPAETATAETAPVFDIPLDLGTEAAQPTEPEKEAAGVDAEATPPSPGDEELPLELRALLEETDEWPAVVVEQVEPDREQAMADDSAEAAFYIEQGMLDEARAVYRRMQARDPDHPAAISLGARLAAPAAGVAPESLEPMTTPPASDVGTSVPPEVTPSASLRDLVFPEEPSPELEAETLGTPSEPQDEPPEQQPTELPVDIEEAHAAPSAGEPSPISGPASSVEEIGAEFTLTETGGAAPAEGFVNLGAELENELAAPDQNAASPGGGPLMNGLLEEFQKGVREHLDEKDFETHYNLGIAYKEMELYEEAVQEFRLAGRDPGRALACADLLGMCFVAMGQLDQAVLEYRAGLEIQGHPKESYHTLRYNLGLAYETQGDFPRALEQFELVPAEDPRFHEVREKLKSLRERVPRPVAAPGPSAPTPPAAAPRRAKEKKISFI